MVTGIFSGIVTFLEQAWTVVVAVFKIVAPTLCVGG